MPVPLLTPNLFNPTTQALLRSAYNRCLDLEYRYEKVLKHGRLDVLVCARMLGYMIIESPTEEGRTEIASEIMRYTRRGDKGLQTLAETYLNHFIRIFYIDKDRMPFADVSREDVRSIQTTNGRRELNHISSREDALERDRHCCVISGRKNLGSAIKGLTSIPAPACAAQCAQILGWSTNSYGNKLTSAASTAAFLRHYGQIKVKGELDGKNIHRLENILTLSSDVQVFYDKLLVWLNKDSQNHPNTYQLASAQSNVLLNEMPGNIRLTTTTGLPLPDPRYIAFHAACARVADKSGARCYMLERIREITDSCGIMEDDRSSDTLWNGLTRLVCLFRKRLECNIRRDRKQEERGTTVVIPTMMEEEVEGEDEKDGW